MENQPAEMDTPQGESDALLPGEIERLCADAWQRGAVEIILLHGAAKLATAAGEMNLEGGTWVLARWAGLTLKDLPDGELVCVLPGRT